MSIEVLKQVREIETEALTIIEEAHKNASKQIAAAKTSAAETEEQARSQARITIGEAKDQAIRDAEVEIKQLRDRHAAERDEIRREGLKHMDTAISLLLKRMIG